MTKSADIDVSVVIPCYNEEMNAGPIAEAVIAQLEPLGVSFDIIFIDNHSTDNTVAIIKAMCLRDPRIRLIANTRNFGQMRSPTHGIYAARGRAVIGMCADFQDSPELLPHFVRRWQEGVDIVLGVREREKSGLMLSVIRALSYWLAKNFGDFQTIPNATGFGLYSRRVVDAIRALNEPEPFYRGLLVETGFPLETINYVRPPRVRGKSKNNFFTLLDFAIAGLTGSSKRLLRAPLYLSVLGAVVSLLMLVGAGIAFFTGRPIAGWLIGMVLQAQFALIFGFMGLMGDHIRQISERTRGTPLVLERERVNFPEDYG
ncbi:glycosyltransferase involved in cell wall biosynthesis [Novosphingobium sp. SG751A]|uniref:glycosyltransferase family 2 protein n=1 Tax=Novosphingobium sp. SG751A TaxID=2587000 RepID=UPI00155804A0|nr:glycosyltransferase family 2 protein [Novosphingobium sp. SG751A]NOW46773.1 glycosyltransferase involved in cell wall biosynthesis [Novosphingobium sp. SG751A]